MISVAARSTGATRTRDKLPAVLNAKRGVRFLDAVEGLRNRIALTTAYAAGLRVREVTRLGSPSPYRQTASTRIGLPKRKRGKARNKAAAIWQISHSARFLAFRSMLFPN